MSFNEETQIFWASSREESLFVADLFSIIREQENIFIIGGSEIYNIFEDIVNRVYLTEVFADVPGDAYFRMKFPRKQWKTIDETDYAKDDKNEHPSRLTIIDRRERRYRREFFSRFFTSQPERNDWLLENIRNNEPKIKEFEEQHQLEIGFSE